MKKSILTMLITGMLLGIVGCGSVSEKKSPAETEAIQKEEGADNTANTSEENALFSDAAALEKLGTPIPEQTFEVVLNDWGEVTFASFAPQNSSFMADGLNPDVRFCLVDDGEVLCEMPGWNEEHTNADLFLGVSAVAFKDYNDDGLLDVITLCEYEAMSGEGFQTARIYFQLEDKQGFAEDTLLTEYLAKNNKTESIAVILDAKEEYWDYNSSMDGHRSVYHQIQIMAENKDLWTETLEFADEVYQYAVADLDRNGRYEVIVANMGGIGSYTYSSFFEVNENYDGLVKCEADFTEGDSQPDIITEELDTYIDDEGVFHYAVYDLMKNGAAEYCENVRGLTLQDGKIVIEPIAYRTTIYQDGVPAVTCKDADENSITEADYESAAEKYFAGCEKRTTCLGWQDVRELAADTNGIGQQLNTSVDRYLCSE